MKLSINFAALLLAVSLLGACAEMSAKRTSTSTVSKSGGATITVAPLPPPAVNPVAVTAPPRFVGKPEPFQRGVRTPSSLRNGIQASLAQDPTGNSVVNPARCKIDKSCATPAEYLAMFRQADPSAKLDSFSDMIVFLSELVPVDAPSGEYWMACRRRDERGVSHPVLHCVSRKFKKGEKAWVNKRTGRLVLAEDCTNPIEKPVSLECASIVFSARDANRTHAKDMIGRYAIVGPEFVDDGCLGMRRPNDTEYERWWVDHCPSQPGCDFSQAADVLKKHIRVVGSVATDEPGEYALRVPKHFTDVNSPYVVLLALERQDECSDARGVNWFEYQARSTDMATAIVWYSKAETPPSVPPVFWTWGEWERRGYVPAVAPASAFIPSGPPPVQMIESAPKPARSAKPTTGRRPIPQVPARPEDLERGVRVRID